MGTKELTKWFIGASVAAIVGYDVYVLVESTPGDTISDTIRGWANYWFVPLSLGAVMGHWFLPLKSRQFGPWLLTGIVAGVAGLDFLHLTPQAPPSLVVLAGFLLGAALWGHRSTRPLT